MPARRAISTALGVGAISIIRVSGNDAVTIVNKITKNKKLDKVSSHTINYDYIIDENEIIDAIPELPDPDRIFFGGGSEELEAAFQRLKPGGILVATGILVETCARLASILPEHRKELLSLNISRSGEFSGGLHLWRAENPITIAVFEK